MATGEQIQESIESWLLRGNRDRDSACLDLFGIGISTDIGVEREINQDRAVIVRLQSRPYRYLTIAVLSDGMGGMDDGEVCASITVSSFLANCIKNRNNRSLEDVLTKAVFEANSAVYSRYNDRGGATLSALIVDEQRNAYAANVGDSRIYAHTLNEVTQLSSDDTLDGQLVNHKIEANHLKNQLLQYVGMKDGLDPNVFEINDFDQIRNIVITSDGAHFLDNDVMCSILSHSDDPCELSERLIKASIWCGSKDNASTIVLNNPNDKIAGGESSQLPSGTIHFWDSFGDMRLIGVERINQNLADNIVEQKQPQQESLFDDQKQIKKKTKRKKLRKKVGKKTAKPDVKVDLE